MCLSVYLPVSITCLNLTLPILFLSLCSSHFTFSVLFPLSLSLGFGDNRKAMLQDLAVITGGQVVSEDLGLKLENVTEEYLGTCAKIKVNIYMKLC